MVPRSTSSACGAALAGATRVATRVEVVLPDPEDGGGRAGSVSQSVACQPIVATWLAGDWPAARVTTRPADPSAAKDTDGWPPSARAGAGSGADCAQCTPPSGDHAATTDAAGPLPTVRTALVRPAVVVSATTSVPPRAAEPVSRGAAACRARPESVKIPVTPGLLQSPATSGAPAGVHATAVSAVSPQARPAGAAASTRSEVREVQCAPTEAADSTAPVLVSASRPPAELPARAFGTAASPGFS